MGLRSGASCPKQPDVCREQIGRHGREETGNIGHGAIMRGQSRPPEAQLGRVQRVIIITRYASRISKILLRSPPGPFLSATGLRAQPPPLALPAPPCSLLLPSLPLSPFIPNLSLARSLLRSSPPSLSLIFPPLRSSSIPSTLASQSHHNLPPFSFSLALLYGR